MNEKMRIIRMKNRKRVNVNRNYGGLGKSQALGQDGRSKLPQIISKGTSLISKLAR